MIMNELTMTGNEHLDFTRKIVGERIMLEEGHNPSLRGTRENTQARELKIGLIGNRQRDDEKTAICSRRLQSG